MSGLQVIAAEIAMHLHANGFTADDAGDRQTLCLAEEVGEFVAAYRRWRGWARRSGSFQEVEEELADVVITAYVTAAELGIDLDGSVHKKLAVIFTRGWREMESNQ